MTRRCSRLRVGLAYTLATIGIGISCMAVPERVAADAHNYASTKRQIKACVLVSNAAVHVSGGVTIPENATPYVFYMLDRRTDLKPAGWEFVNPLAPSSVTGDILQRWTARDTTSTDTSLNNAANPVFVLGAPLTKNMGAYWEVNLDTISQSDLQQFDIVLLAYHTGATAFNPTERDLLRKYADAGGTIWLEDEGGFDIQSGGDHTQNQFVLDTAFNGAALSAANYPSLGTLHHPLVNFPYPISNVQVQSLGSAGIGTHHVALDPISGPVNPRVVVPVIFSGAASSNAPAVYAGDYGAGHIVISSLGIATGINSYVGGSSVANENGNSGAVSGENVLGVQLTDAQFAYNMIAWTSSVSTGAFNARRSGGSREDIGYALGSRWSTIPNATGAVQDSGPVVYKNCVFYVDGSNILHCYDLAPAEDLDNDGNPDDGIKDYANGSPYDEVWNVDLKSAGISGWNANTRFGPPTIFSVNQNGVVVDEIAVQGSNGSTAVFNAFTMNGAVLATSPALLYTVTSGGASGGDYAPNLINQHSKAFFGAPSPALSDGILFSIVYDSAIGTVTDTNNAWHIFPTDPITGQNVFGNNKLGVAPSPQTVLFQANQSLQVPILGMSMPVGSPMVGYVTDTTTGAQDKMVYVPTMPQDNSTSNGGGDGVFALLFSSKNDPLSDIYMTTYASGLNIPQYTVFRAFGNRGNIPWFAPAASFGGMRTLLPRCHKTSGGVTIDLTYDPTGGTPNSFKVVSRLPQGIQNQHETLVVVNPPLLPGDTITADYTVDWPGYPLNDFSTNTPNPIVSRDFNQVFPANRIVNPYGTTPGVVPLYFTGGAALTPDDEVFVNVGDAPYADRIYAIHNHFSDTSATIAGGGKPEGPAVRWMFFPNGPVPDEGIYTGNQSLRPRLINSDTFDNTFNAAPPMIVSDLESIGTPAYSNGVVYQTGWAHMQYGLGAVGGAVNEWDATVIMAYKANPSLTFVPRNSDGTVVVMQDTSSNSANGQPTRPVTLVQVDLVHLQPGVPAKLITLTEGSNFIVDYNTSTISIYNCQSSATGDAFNLAMPFTVVQNGATLSELLVNANGYGLLDNLLWWMIVPLHPYKSGVPDLSNPFIPYISGLLDVQPASGPTVIGSTLYYGTSHGNIAALDLSNMPQDGSQATLFKTDHTTRIRTAPVLWDTIRAQAVDQPISSPPVGTTDVVVVTSPQGITAFDNQLTLISDNNRLIEVNHAGQAVWSLDATQTQTLVAGALGVAGNIASAKISLARPNSAQHDSLNTYIVADSGNNRVMQVNKGGIVGWELHSFTDGMQFLRPGDPFTLNHPTDVQTYTLIGNGPISFTSPISGAVYSYSGYYYSYHFIIADSGNNRDLEIVDIYDANGNPIVMTAAGKPNVTMYRQLIFVTRTTSEQNKRLRYRTVQQFVAPDGKSLFLSSVIDNEALEGADPDNLPISGGVAAGAGGSVVIMSRAGGANDGALASKLTALFNPNPAYPQHTPITGPTYFKEFEGVDGKVHYLLCDANGCYELMRVQDTAYAGQTQNGEAVVIWALYSTDYLAMTGRPLKAASIQRLGQADYYAPTNLFYPHYLITNRYTGDDNIVAAFGGGAPLLNATSSQVRGEVVEVRGDVYYNTGAYPQGYRSPQAALYANNSQVLTLNSQLSAIVWIVPKETISSVPGLYPIKRSIGLASDSGTSSYILEQPTSSQRPY